MDDPLLLVASLFQVALIGAGIAFVCSANRMRTPADLEADVLAALPHDEALSVVRVCERAPLASQAVDREVVSSTLEHLRRTGRAVRWYQPDREAVYRRVA